MSNSTIQYKGVNKLQAAKSSAELDANILSTINFSKKDILANGIYIFGIGKLGQQVHAFLSENNIPIIGYIDNNKRFHGKVQNENKITGVDVLNENDIVYIASETYLTPIHQQLKEMGITKVLSHYQGSILFKSAKTFPFDAHFEGLTEDLIASKEYYLQVFSLLKDDESKRVFDNLISYRLTGTIEYINGIASIAALEYFDESVFTLTDSEIFFDCGGFDGDSAQNFIAYSKNNYQGIHIFEPDKLLLSKAKERLAGHENIFFNDVGIYNTTTTLRFDSTGGLDGSIHTTGNVEINTVALDEYNTTQIPTYIKLDIEGVEIEALNGGRKLIRKYCPKLAIAAYHFPKHFWEIPLHVLTINPQYNLHLRHYSNCIFGSTYYFLPC